MRDVYNDIKFRFVAMENLQSALLISNYYHNVSFRDCYIPSVSDKYKSVVSYETFEELQLKMDFDGKARIIQRCYRGYRIIKFIKICAKIYRETHAQCERQSEENFENRRKFDVSDCRALNQPQTLTDVDALLHHIDTVDLPKFDIKEQSYSPRTRKLRLLDERRSAYITAELRRRNRIGDQAKFLAYHCKPKFWLGRSGQGVEMLSLKNQVARELWIIYQKLNAEKESEEQRMEILLQSRRCVEKHICKDANSFRELVDQELVMVSKGIHTREKLDNYLRKRIIGAFLQFVKTSHNCTCKSEDGIKPVDIFDYDFRLPLEKDRILCKSCWKLLPLRKYPVTLRRPQMNKCKACIRLRGNVRGHVDLKPYIHLLSEIRETELAAEPIIDILSPSDLRHIVYNIWHGRSVLSGESEPKLLRLPRYLAQEPWSPWNCLLLTKEEADVHRSLGNKILYSEPLRKIIDAAHCTARLSFASWTVERKLEVKSVEDSFDITVNPS